MEKLITIRIIRKSSQVAARIYIKEFCNLCGIYTEDYEVDREKNIDLREKDGWINLFLVSSRELNVNVTGCKNIYAPVDEDINLVTKELRRNFGEKLRKYIIQDISNILGYDKKLIDEITIIYDIFVKEDFAHHNYIEELFKDCIYEENECYKQYNYFYNISCKLGQYCSLDKYSYLLRAFFMCNYKCNIYCGRTHNIRTFNEKFMQDFLYSQYSELRKKMNKNNLQPLETAILCHRLGEESVNFDVEYDLEHELVNLYIKNANVQRHNFYEYTKILRYWCKITLYYCGNAYDSQLLRIYDKVINMCPMYYEGYFAKIGFFQSRANQEKVKNEYITKFYDELDALYYLMLEDFEKNRLEPHELLNFYYTVKLLANSSEFYPEKRVFFKAVEKDLPDWVQTFKNLPITKKFITNDTSYDKWIVALNIYYTT